MKSFRKGFAAGCSGYGNACATSIAVAVGALLCAVPNASRAMEEIVVTAQKREQNIQDVGIAMSAYTGAQLAEYGITNSAQITEISAGVRNPMAGSGFSSSYSIRGVSQNEYGASQEAPVALYLDEVYQVSPGATQFLLFDMDRVEILRGPQGTLFGRNATGGLVHFISKKPTQDSDGYVELSYGRYNDVRMEAALGGGLTDNVSARVSMAGRWHDPIVHNSTGPDLWDAGQFGARGQLLYKPGSDFSFLMSGRVSRQRETGQPYVWAAASPTGPGGTGEFTPGAADNFGFAGPVDPFHVSIDPVSRHDSDTHGLTGTASWNLGFATLTSISDFTNIDVTYEEDSDMIPGEFFHFFGTQNAHQFSEELRLNGDAGKVHWVAGMYYLDWTGDFLQRGLLTGFEIPGVTAQDTVYDSTTSSWSIFGQGEYEFTEHWRAIVGVRYILDHKEENYQSAFKHVPGGTSVGFGSSPELLVFNGVRNDNLYAVKAELDWKPTSDVLAYVSFNRGVKAGGFNAPLDPSGSPVFIDPNTFDPAPTADAAMHYKPESLYSYEVGAKLSFFDDKARFNSAFFYYDYSDFQSLNFEGLTNYIVNRDATFKGIDAELAATPIENLDLMLGFAWLDHKIKDVAVGNLVVDRQNAYAPKWSGSALARYQWQVAGGKLALQGLVSFVGSQYLGLSNAPVLHEDSYTLVNARLSYSLPGDRFSVALFADNLTDERYRVTAFDTAISFGSIENQYGYPRTYGISLRYNWGK